MTFVSLAVFRHHR